MTSGVVGAILAGVHRWEETSFDRLMSRPLMPVAHTPLICHTLSWLRESGVRRACICANSESQPVRGTLGDGAETGVELHYYEDWTPRGPAGCVRDAIERMPGEHAVVVDGTILPNCDLSAALRAHVESGASATILVARDGSLTGRDRLTPVGICLLRREALQRVSETGYQDIKEVLLPRLHASGQAAHSFTVAAMPPRITDRPSYLSISSRVVHDLARAEGTPRGYRRVRQALVHESARVLSPERLIGPALIGPETYVLEGATLLGPVTLGAACIVEPGAVVARSVAWDGCRIGARAMVDQSVLGDGAQAPGGEVVSCAAVCGDGAVPLRAPQKGESSRLRGVGGAADTRSSIRAAPHRAARRRDRASAGRSE